MKEDPPPDSLLEPGDGRYMLCEDIVARAANAAVSDGDIANVDPGDVDDAGVVEPDRDDPAAATVNTLRLFITSGGVPVMTGCA